MPIAANRIIREASPGRVVLLLAICAALALALGGCGGGSDADTESTVALENEADVEVLNQILGRQRAAVDAYDRTLAEMHGRPRALATRLRTQEQEHTVAILEALRKLGGTEEVEEEEIEAGTLTTEADRLRFLYAVEAATIEDELSAIGRLNRGVSRALMATTMANQAQHLVMLRRALGASPVEWLPGAFEDGSAPAP